MASRPRPQAHTNPVARAPLLLLALLPQSPLAVDVGQALQALLLFVVGLRLIDGHAVVVVPLVLSAPSSHQLSLRPAPSHSVVSPVAQALQPVDVAAALLALHSDY